MAWLDAPGPFARTPRELLLLAVGAAYVVYELALESPSWPNAAVYLAATVAFALRFFPARAIGAGVALGALAQRLPELRVAATELTVPHTWAALGVLVLLASEDLEARFERAPSRIGWLTNAWAALPARDLRALRLCAYALGMLVATLAYAWDVPRLALPGVAAPVLGALGLVLALLVAGRAPALLLVPVVCLPVAAALAAQVPAAEAMLAGDAAIVGHGFETTPQHVLPSVLLALFASAIALPYAVRLVRRV